jgi:methylenetetrahydrofolate reductase (NADPH)
MTDAVVADQNPKPRIVALARSASIELTTQDEGQLALLSQVLPDALVYVAHTPKATLQDVVRTAVKAQAAGLRTCPHIVARRIDTRRALQDAAEALADAGVRHALVIAGDATRAAGDFQSSLDVLHTEVLTRNDIVEIGVAGHPEGHRAIGQTTLWNALLDKQALAQRLGVRMHIVTQFGFDLPAIVRWVHHLAEHGVSLPVHVGMAGPASLPELIRYAMHCGVGASLRGVLQNMHAMRNVAGLATTPERMLTGIARASAGECPQIAAAHLFSFGGTLPAARWLRAVGDGRIDLPATADRFTITGPA